MPGKILSIDNTDGQSASNTDTFFTVSRDLTRQELAYDIPESIIARPTARSLMPILNHFYPAEHNNYGNVCSLETALSVLRQGGVMPTKNLLFKIMESIVCDYEVYPSVKKLASFEIFNAPRDTDRHPEIWDTAVDKAYNLAFLRFCLPRREIDSNQKKILFQEYLAKHSKRVLG